MVGRRRGAIPGPLARGRDRFEAWRRTCCVGDRIPERLWSLAVALAAAHGLSRTATVLKLDYYSLRKRVAAGSSDSGMAASPFVELRAPLPPSPFIELSASPAAAGECVVELEDGSGARMFVHLRGCAVPDVVALARSFRSGE